MHYHYSYMPIILPDTLPAKKILEKEHVFVRGKNDALLHDVHTLKIAIVNLMPRKVQTEIELLRVLSNTALPIKVEFIRTATHDSINTPYAHLETFYKTFDEIKNSHFDGLIVTGAPVEHLAFEEVDYWVELKKIIAWAERNVTSTLYICWAAQACLYYRYGIKKFTTQQKIFGVFPHKAVNPKSPLLRGFDETYFVPHSRHTGIRCEDIKKIKNLEVLSISDEAGVHIIASKNGRRFFITGHGEYDDYTLKYEYDRDRSNGLPIQIPKNYYPNDNPTKAPLVKWRSHGFLLYSNWLNYYVYQASPYHWVAIL
jgi:homoserine O-succinyltransferase/O-acetyltransferase